MAQLVSQNKGYANVVYIMKSDSALFFVSLETFVLSNVFVVSFPKS